MFAFKVLSITYLAVGAVAAPSGSSLPQVDLGYQIQQACSFNESTQIYNFSNIRYAQPPVGKLRFAAPVAPTGRNTVVQNGSVGSICPQAYPAWGPIGTAFTSAFAKGTESSFNFSAAEAAVMAAQANSSAPTVDPRTTEDCLFLDVFVPKGVFSKKSKTGKGGAAVLVWIYGGGYVFGYKNIYGSPETLMRSAQAAGGNGIVYVQLNYRLGALGWLSGPSLEAAGGVSNSALYDQRLAIQWISKNIHLFGGDPNRITLLGESAGGGSIMHQITAFGGQKPVQFQQAIPQSPGWALINSNYQQENTTQTFLGLLGVSSIAEARQASSKAVITANYKQVLNSAYGHYTYGPVVDGIFVPAQPGALLAAGAYAKSVKVMPGHNANEGVLFADPRVKTDEQLTEDLQFLYPGISPTIVDYIIKTLYPAVYDGTYPYTSAIDRTILIGTESIFTCNTYWLDKAQQNKSYAYEFEVPPSVHGEDIVSTFYNGQGNVVSEGLIAKVAEALQAYITNFAMTGNPNGKGLPKFPVYGNGAMEEGLNYTGFNAQRDPSANARCDWWQLGLWQ